MNRGMAASTMRVLSVVLVLSLLVLVSGYARAQPRSVTATFVQWVKLTASDGAEGDDFGGSVSISGGTVVIGAWEDDESGENSGSAYVFDRDEGGPGTWGQAAKLTASDGSEWDMLGFSVSISGDTVVVSAIGDEYGLGSAYIFERDAGEPGNWVQVAKLTAFDGAAWHEFGQALSISGDVVVIGSNESACLFEKPVTGWDDTIETAKLTASDGAAYDDFGGSVSISGETVVVGAHQDDDNGSESGSVYLFEKPVTGWDNLTETAKVTASDGAPGDEFGISVAISGDIVVVGAPGDDENGRLSGSAYIFERDAGGPDNWGEVAKLTASDGSEYHFFGESVATSGDTVVAGAYGDNDHGIAAGSVYLFEKPDAGWTSMTETAKLTASDGAVGDSFGKSVSVSGDTLVVGASRDDDMGDASGSAYVFIEFEPVARVYLPAAVRSVP